MIARIVEEKENEEEDLIELRATEEMVPRRFHKYLKVFEKKDSERGSCHRSQRRICTKERQDLSVVKSRKRGGTRICEGPVEEGIH